MHLFLLCWNVLFHFWLFSWMWGDRITYVANAPECPGSTIQELCARMHFVIVYLDRFLDFMDVHKKVVLPVELLVNRSSVIIYAFRLGPFFNFWASVLLPVADLTLCEVLLNENIYLYGTAYTEHLFCVFKLTCALYFKEKLFVKKLVIVGGAHCKYKCMYVENMHRCVFQIWNVNWWQTLYIFNLLEWLWKSYLIVEKI